MEKEVIKLLTGKGRERSKGNINVNKEESDLAELRWKMFKINVE